MTSLAAAKSQKFHIETAADAASDAVQSAKSSVETALNSVATDASAAAGDLVAALKQTIEKNPTAALAAVTALGFVAALAIMPSRNAQMPKYQKMQREFGRQAKELRKTVRQELRQSGIENRVDSFAQFLNSAEIKQLLQPFLDQGVNLATQAKDKIQATLKSA